MPSIPSVCRADLHFYEEPNISGENGSGAIFFSGCVLRCEFCQNYEISRENCGAKADVSTLCELMKKLCEKGAHNINFVSPTPYLKVIARALRQYKPPIPIVYNCSGYENPEALRELEGLVDIYLPDFKYADDSLAVKYSAAPDYYRAAVESIKEMYRQVGRVTHDDNGMMKKGVMIRHLILPDCVENSKRVLRSIRDNFSADAYVSLMAQYTPNGCTKSVELSRKITPDEYDGVCDFMLELGFENGFVQELSAADEKYVPVWDMK
ncbi:MAG: radical SAM protein [Clostridia bacterium]|nr:radical SAM protein [Clostridia bacterium]